MTARPTTVRVVGATGGIGRLAVDEAIRQGHAVRAHLMETTASPCVAGTLIGQGFVGAN